MVSSRVLLFFLSAIFMPTAQAVARPAFLYHFCALDQGNYTGNSTYLRILNGLLFNLSSNTEIDYGFYNSSYGRNPDQVHAIGLCRGDVNPDACRGCLNNAASLLIESCFYQKEAIGWYDYCMLRYSNRSILGVEETSPSFYMWNNNVSANYVNQFNDVLRSLLESLRSKAVAGGSLRKFAAGNAVAPNFQTLYALVQCTPDLSEEDCNICLVEAFKNIPQCCDGKQSGRVMTPSCNIRFDVFPFYNHTTAAWPPPTTSTPTNENKTEAQGSKRYPIFVIIILVLTGSAVVALIIGLGIRTSVKYVCRRNNDGTTNEITRIELQSLQVNHGSEANQNGQGGYGTIYERYTQIKKKLSGMRKKKNGSFLTPNINEEEEEEIHEELPIPDGSLETDDDDAVQLRPPRRWRRPSSSSSSRSSHVSQLTRELDEYKRRCEEAERRQQEIEANQRQMEQQIQFLMSQLQLRRDDVPPK